jgi:hypothetical protein
VLLLLRPAALCVPLALCLSLPSSAAAMKPARLPLATALPGCQTMASAVSGQRPPVADYMPGCQPAAFDDPSPLDATLRVLRPAGPEELAAASQRAQQSAELAAARQRLAPLVIDTAAPRAVGTTVGLVGLYYPIRGAIDGVTSQYALWFDTSTDAVVAEADFVRRANGQYARLVTGGSVVLDGMLDKSSRSTDEFWKCLDWCLGAVANDDLILVLHAACVKFCGVWPSELCVACLVAVGTLELGMVSGCTYTCWHRG